VLQTVDFRVAGPKAGHSGKEWDRVVQHEKKRPKEPQLGESLPNLRENGRGSKKVGMAKRKKG